MHNTLSNIAFLSYFAQSLIGIIFLVTGAAKALDLRRFIQHIFRYELFPAQSLSAIALWFISVECTLGTALILNVHSQWIIPGSIVLLVGLSALTLWATSSGRTEDCGCYGGLLVIPPKLSIQLNISYILLLGISWLNPVSVRSAVPWEWGLICLVFISSFSLSFFSRDEPLVDFSRLKVGNRWKCIWLKENNQGLLEGDHFVVFLSKDCPYCKRWIPFLNIMSTQDNSPKPQGIMPLTDQELEVFKREQKAQFSLLSMDKLLFGYMVEALPTAVLLEGGVITGKWVGEIPELYLDRAKLYYEKVFSKANNPAAD